MTNASELIKVAFDNLRSKPGFVERTDQRQLGLLLSDLMTSGSRGAFEAPTGLGKSLATLIPAIAHGMASKKRVVVATYTNVLAEQYWRHDLPLALSLFPENREFRAQLLMGRQRYACLAAMDEVLPQEVDQLKARAKHGIESEFRQIVKRPYRELTSLWQKVTSPPVCGARTCPAYDDCFYYNARRKAESAELIITNHSVVIQDAVLASYSDDDEGLLGKIDFLVLDEAHDFQQAAMNGLEFELSSARLNALIGIAKRYELLLLPLAQAAGEGMEFMRAHLAFHDAVNACMRDLVAYAIRNERNGILDTSPEELLEHPQVSASRVTSNVEAFNIADRVSVACGQLAAASDSRMAKWKAEGSELARSVSDTARVYTGYLKAFGIGCQLIFKPDGVSVSYSSRTGTEAILRRDVIGLAEPLRELIWNRTPYACISATLATDGNFEYFTRSTGAEPEFTEILPSPFDYPSNAAIYLPPNGAVQDPANARKMGTEDDYYRQLALEIGKIIRAMDGRTLALFHSRKEMEGVYSHIVPHPDRPILIQERSGFADVGQRFVKNPQASLFGLRSFWTGFDAPGETLSCVIVVRIPFEVPIDPPQIARLAYLQSIGLNAFAQHTLPLAKMMVRQGAGRLIRRAEDKGVIAVLDSRVRTKNYGEEILANLPEGMRVFTDIEDAVGFLELGTA